MRAMRQADHGRTHPVTRWVIPGHTPPPPQPSPAWPPPGRSEITLTGIIATWGRYYTAWFDGADYRAVRAHGTPLTPASTPAGLDSAIRADYTASSRGAR